jgi:hypothetical protein
VNFGRRMIRVIHLTRPEKKPPEMRRLLMLGGTLIVVNLDPGAINRPGSLRSIIRILCGFTG